MLLVILGKALAFPLMGRSVRSSVNNCGRFLCLSCPLDFTSFPKILPWPLLCLVSINLNCTFDVEGFLKLMGYV